jgi:hypothetical protein
VADEIIEQRVRDGDVWLSYERRDSQDVLLHNPTPRSQELLATFPASSTADETLRSQRLDAAERYLAGHKDVGWRVRLEDAGTLGPEYLLEFGRVVTVDDKGNATVDFECDDLPPVEVRAGWLAVDLPSIWP